MEESEREYWRSFKEFDFAHAVILEMVIKRVCLGGSEIERLDMFL